jgi:hypothetical protein
VTSGGIFGIGRQSAAAFAAEGRDAADILHRVTVHKLRNGDDMMPSDDLDRLHNLDDLGMKEILKYMNRFFINLLRQHLGAMGHESHPPLLGVWFPV